MNMKEWLIIEYSMIFFAQKNSNICSALLPLYYDV